MNRPKKLLNHYLLQSYPYKYERRQSLSYWLIKYMDKKSPYYDMDSQLKDLVNHGCASGCIGDVIYTWDCLKFYQKYEQQIWELVYEFWQDTGQSLGQFIDSFSVGIEDEDSLRTYLSWFAIEQTAFRLLSHLEERRDVA